VHGQNRPMTPVKIHSYDDLIAAIRARVIELQVAYLTVDHVGGLANGHFSKLMQPRGKLFGRTSLALVLDALGVRLELHLDDEAFARVRKQLVRRKTRLPDRFRLNGSETVHQPFER
jgi:hypothetical protein